MKKGDNKEFCKICTGINMTMLRIRIKELRKESGLSQNTFADELGFSRSSVAAWEVGTRLPNMYQLNKMSKYFNVTNAYLIGMVEGRLQKQPYAKNVKK